METLKELSKVLSTKGKKTKEKLPLKNRRKITYTLHRTPAHGRSWWPCARVRLRPLQHGCAPPMHGHVSLRVFLLALPGLRLTSTLLLIPLESYLFHQNPKVFPENTDKLQCKHN